MGPRLSFAPLHGVTNRTFRKAYFAHFGGFDEAVAPFILAVRTDRAEARHFKDLIPREAGGPRIVPQLLGNEAAAFVDTARILADSGYDEANWNLGCPFPQVAGKARGSGLLPFPERIGAFLDEACAHSPLPVSVKLRLGRESPDEIIRLMPILNAHPLARLIIHPRLGVQMYSGEVDLEGFRAAAALSRHEVEYNGDIADLAGFECLAARFPAVDGWMLGRGAIADPFLAASIKGDAGAGAMAAGEKLAIIRAFHEDLFEGYRGILSGPAHLLDKMKEVWTYLAPSFPGKGQLLGQVARAKTVEAYGAAVKRIFA